MDQPFQGWLGEVLVFNRNLDDAERKLDELRTKLRDQVLAEESVAASDDAAPSIAPPH